LVPLNCPQFVLNLCISSCTVVSSRCR